MAERLAAGEEQGNLFAPAFFVARNGGDHVNEPELLVTPAGAIDEAWFIRPKDAARLVGLDETTIRLAINQGRLAARKFRGRGWLIERDALRVWIEAESEPNRAA
jgi:excisionase family DNA binding protein